MISGNDTASHNDVELLERVALSFIEKLNVKIAFEIVENFGSLHSFFALSAKEVSDMFPGNINLLDLILQRDDALKIAEVELQFIRKFNIKVINVLDQDKYPIRLFNCPDAPLNLFILGNTNLNAEHMISVVGTRNASPYGISMTNKLLEDLQSKVGDVTVISGLAYGIDKCAHEAALRLGMPTVAVVAHGLGMIYPASHRQLATTITQKGGAIISEYPHFVSPYRGHFLERNRIIAGLSDAVLVAESKKKGGALNTAAHARSYDREVLALPGRATDINSEGCNNMINAGLALSVTTAEQIANAACWKLKTDKLKSQNKSSNTDELSIFDTYDGNIKIIYDFLKCQLNPVTLDYIVIHTGLSAKEALTALGELDLDGLLTRYAGARFSL